MVRDILIRMSVMVTFFLGACCFYGVIVSQIIIGDRAWATKYSDIPARTRMEKLPEDIFVFALGCGFFWLCKYIRDHYDE